MSSAQTQAAAAAVVHLSYGSAETKDRK